MKTIWAIYHAGTIIGACAPNQEAMVALLSDCRILDDDTFTPWGSTLIEEFGEDYLDALIMLPWYEFLSFMLDSGISYQELDFYEH